MTRIPRYAASHTTAGDALIRTFAAAVGNAELPSEDVRMGHGGKREGAGRKPRGEAAASIKVTVKLTEAEAAELTGGMRDGETLAQLLRDGGLRLVRARRTPETP